MLTFIDDYSKKVWVCLSWNIIMMSLGSLSNGKLWLRSWQKDRSNAWELTVTWNYVGMSSMSCKNEGILRHHIVRHTLEQSGVVEWINETFLRRAWCMLGKKGLHKKRAWTSMKCFLHLWSITQLGYYFPWLLYLI